MAHKRWLGLSERSRHVPPLRHGVRACAASRHRPLPKFRQASALGAPRVRNRICPLTKPVEECGGKDILKWVYCGSGPKQRPRIALLPHGPRRHGRDRGQQRRRPDTLIRPPPGRACLAGTLP